MPPAEGLPRLRIDFARGRCYLSSWGTFSKGWLFGRKPAQAKLHADDHKLAGALFGQQNRHLRQIEQLTGVRASSSGQGVTLEGEEARVAHALRLLDGLARLLAKGFPLRAPDIEYADRILRAEPPPACPTSSSIPSRSRPAIKRLLPSRWPRRHYVDAIRAVRRGLRHRPGRHRQDLSGHGHGGGVPAEEGGQPHRPGTSGGRGRRKARFPPRRPGGKGQSLSAAACTMPSST